MQDSTHKQDKLAFESFIYSEKLKEEVNRLTEENSSQSAKRLSATLVKLMVFICVKLTILATLLSSVFDR